MSVGLSVVHGGWWVGGGWWVVGGGWVAGREGRRDVWSADSVCLFAGTFVSESMRDLYPKSVMVNQVVWPHRSGGVIVQAYNVLLTVSHLQEASKQPQPSVPPVSLPPPGRDARGPSFLTGGRCDHSHGE